MAWELIGLCMSIALWEVPKLLLLLLMKDWNYLTWWAFTFSNRIVFFEWESLNWKSIWNSSWIELNWAELIFLCSCLMQNPNWVLCRIFLKKRSTRERDEKKNNNNCKPVFHQFLRTRNDTDLNLSPCSSSSGSSGVTEISVNNHQEQEETSSCSSYRKRWKYHFFF